MVGNFTIPTNKSCSLVLKFEEIQKILPDRQFLVSVGLGELPRAAEVANVGVDWLHAPKGWPILASASEEDIFTFDPQTKKIQIDNGNGARIWLGYAEMISLAESLQITTMQLPLPAIPVEKNSSKLKRKMARYNASIEESKNVAVAYHGPVCLAGHSFENKRIVRVPRRKSLSNEDWLQEIKSQRNADVIVHTDFPFLLAREGLLIDEDFQIVDLKHPDMFSNMEPLLVASDTSPVIVKNAACHARSYVHHLFRCDELSGPVLLAIVNLFQFDKFLQ